MGHYRFVYSADSDMALPPILRTQLLDVGINKDGSLYNPNGYPDDVVRAAVAAADERRRLRRSAAAKKAGVTRRARQEKRIYEIARRIVEGKNTGPRNNCFVCGRGLTDEESIARGIGSECWQEVLSAIQASRAGGDGHETSTDSD